LNAGEVADGACDVEAMGWRLFHLLLATASGQPTWAERHRLHNALVLFNPAPVT
jgi:galactarate dehydratase